MKPWQIIMALILLYVLMNNEKFGGGDKKKKDVADTAEIWKSAYE